MDFDLLDERNEDLERMNDGNSFSLIKEVIKSNVKVAGPWNVSPDE